MKVGINKARLGTSSNVSSYATLDEDVSEA